MADRPIRIQRKRTKGWRLPKNTVYVGRPGRYGNDYQPGATVGRPGGKGLVLCESVKHCVDLYRQDLKGRLKLEPDALEPLRGKNLACWCRLDSPYCHADILLELANIDVLETETAVHG